MIDYKVLTTSQQYRPLVDFWQGLFADPDIEFHTLPAPGAGPGGRQSLPVTLSDASVRVLDKLASDAIGRFTVVTAAIALVIARYFNHKRAILRTPLLADADEPTLNTDGEVPLVLPVSPGATLRELLHQVADTVEQSYSFQDFPVRTLLHDDFGADLAALTEFSLSCSLVHRGTLATQAALHFNADRLDARQISIEWAPDSVAPEIVASLAVMLAASVAHFEHPGVAVKDVERVPADQRELLLATWNQTNEARPALCVHELFERQVERTPDAPALIAGAETISYHELNRSANRVARHLIDTADAGSGSIVGIWMNRSPWVIAAVLGTLKAGLAYLPIDADCPFSRVAYILEDSGAGTLLIDAAKRPEAEPLGRVLIDADRPLPRAAGPEANPGRTVQAGDRAYIIYTSGSTGQPKGCAIAHHSLSNYLQWATDFYWAGRESGTMGFFSPLSFDLTITSLFCPLLRGRSLVVYPQASSIEDILQDQFAPASPVDSVKLTPSHVRILDTLRIRDTNIRTVIVGGEALTADHVRILKGIDPRIRVFNEYGPTEATVGCVVKELASGEPITIGRPIANTRAYVLDDEQKLLPVGVRGEICISGDGLARGYHGREALTAAKFVPHPYVPGERLYRTGDVGRWLPGGELECFERLDDQVKIRGYRVELGEVEAALRACDGVRDVVVVVDVREHAQELVAYVVPEDDREPPALPQRAMALGMRRQLAGRLPDYMIPSAFVRMGSLPLTPNGKIDRRRLPATTGASRSEGSHASPRGHEEQALVRIWQEVFRVERIGADDDFFELGGHSLRAMQMVMRIQQELHVEVSLNDIFKSPTVAALAAVIRRAAPSVLHPIEPVPAADHYAVSHGQKRLWILNQLEENAAAYNVSSAFELVGDVDVPSVERAFARLIDRHESLRTTFDVVDDEPRQRIHLTIDFALRSIDVTAAIDPEQRARHLARIDALEPFDLAKGPLLRATLLGLGPSRFVLVLTMHHIVTDEWSFGVLIEDLVELYRRERLGVLDALTPLPVQYKDFAAWQRTLLADEGAERHRAYWLDKLAGPLPPLDLPKDFPRPDVKSSAGSRYRFSLDHQTTSALKSLGAAHGASLFITLVAIVKVLLRRYTGQEEIRVGIPIAGRRQIELADQVGFYLNTLVLRDRLHAEATFAAILDAVAETATDAYEHDLFPFDRLVEDLDTARDMGRLRLFDVLVVQGNTAPLSLDFANLAVYGFDTPVDVSKFDLAFQFEEDADGIVVELQYDTDLFLPDRMRRLRDHFETLIAAVLKSAAVPIDALEILPAHERGLVELFAATRRTSLRDASGRLAPIGIPADVFVPVEGDTWQPTGARGQWRPDGDLEYLESPGTADATAASAAEITNRRFVPPQTDAELTLAAIWCAALGIESVSVHDNFFELGGDSIIALQIVSRANRAGRRLSLKDLFRHPTIFELTRLAPTSNVVSASIDADATGPLPLTPIERWFFDLDWPAPSFFNQAVLLEVPADFNADLVSQAVERVWEHHDALRLRVTRSDEGWDQTIAPAGPVSAFAVESLPDSARLSERCDQLQRTLNIAEGPLARVVFFRAGDAQPGRLLIVVHHFAIDGLSWRILLEDLMSAHEQLRRHEPVSLPPKTMSFRGWAHRLQAWSDSPAIATDAAYWTRPGDRTASEFPIDFPGGASANIVGSEDHVSIRLDEPATTALLKQVPRAYNTHINDALLTAVAVACASCTGHTAVRVDLEGHGREDQSGDADVSRTVGWFTSLFPVTLCLPRDPDPGEALKAVKETLRGVPSGGLSYGLLRYLARDRTTRAKMAALAPAAIRFNYLGQADQTFHGERWRLAPEATGASQDPLGRRAYLLDVVAIVSDGRLEIDWIFSRACHRRDTVSALADACRGALHALIGHCTAPGAGGFTPSDFPAASITSRDLDRLVRHVGQDSPVRGHIADVYDLTPMQQGLLFHSALAQESGVYVEQWVFRVAGDLDVEALLDAWQHVSNRHDVLRTAFFWQEVAQPVQIVFADTKIPWETLDWRGVPEAEQAAMLRRFLDHDRRRGLDHGVAPLMRCTLIRLDADRHAFCWTSHHILMDGWSGAIVLQEVIAAYQQTRTTRDDMRRPSPPYRSYVEWLRQQDTRQAERYWRTRLDGFARPTPLPTTAPDDALDEPFGKEQRRLDADLTRELAIFGRRHHLTMNTLVSGAWALVLGGCTGALDVVCGATLAGRPASLDGAETMVGLFINTLPMRFRLDPRSQLLSWLHDIQVDQAELDQYSYSSLVDVHRFSDVPRGMPLFESIVVFENYPVERALDPGASQLRITDVAVFEQTNYPLTFVIVPGDELLLRIAYDGSRCDAQQARLLLQHVETLLTAFLRDPHQRVDALVSLIGAAGTSRPPAAPSSAPVHPVSQCRFSLDAELTAAVGALATRHNVPPLVVVRAIAAALHYRYSAHEELLCTVNSAPLTRADVQDTDSLETLIGRPADASTASSPGDPAALAARPDLAITFEVAADRVGVLMQCATERFGEDALRRVQEHFRELAASALAVPSDPITRLNLLPAEELTQLIDRFNRTAKDWGHEKTIVQMFEEQAAQNPGHVAVRVPGIGGDAAARDETWTYAELDARSNQLAQHLIRHHAVGPDVLVGVMAERSFEMVLALMAILKANGAYVPLDPEYPKDRLAFMLEDSGAAVLLTQEIFRPMSSPFDGAVLFLDSDWAGVAGESSARPKSRVGGDNLAYMIYTSGSTGRPKGAMNTHRGIANRLLWMQEAFGLTADDRVLQKTPFSFDVSVWEFFWPLMTGAELVMAMPGGHRDSRYMVDLIEATAITTVHFVPSMLHAFLDEPDVARCSSLKRVICSGEAVSPELLRRYESRLDVPLFNLYGPTEAAVDVTAWRCDGTDVRSVVPIGTPIANTELYILDEWLQPVPIGFAGELFIGGVGVGRGYLNRPDLTAQKFTADPFSTRPGARLYRTGDLSRYRPDGNIEFLGRLDHQVKVRGFRIELGEIEAGLFAHDAVREAVVVVREDRPDMKRLVAYVVAKNGETIRPADIRAHLRNTLPDYMVPSVVVPLADLPRLPNGKLDRHSLPAPESLRDRRADRQTSAPAQPSSARQTPAGTPPLTRPLTKPGDRTATADHDDDAADRGVKGVGSADSYVPPRDDIERLLTTLWQDVLGVEPIGVTDDYFELGGHSLLALKLMSRIQLEVGRNIPLAQLFANPTVERLAAAVRRDTDAQDWRPLVSIRSGGTEPPLFLLPGAGGNIIYFYKLAHELAPGRPVYGLQALGLDGVTPPLSSVADIATLNIEELRRVQPAGPYFLAGHSFGGKVALEMSQQLRQLGEEIGLVTILDTAAPIVEPIAVGVDWEDAHWLAKIAREIEEFFGIRLGVSVDELLPLSPDDQLAFVIDRMRSAGWWAPGADQSLLRGYLRVYKANSQADYVRSQPVDRVPIALIKTMQTSGRGDETPPAILALMEQPAWGWERFASGDVPVREVPGDHLSMLAEPNVRILARAIDDVLAGATIDGTPPAADVMPGQRRG